MDTDRLRKIIAYSEQNREEVHSLVKNFCSFTGIEYDHHLLNVLQIVRSAFQKKGYLVLEIPFADDEIGALCYRGDGLGYVVINSSLPKVNTNFAIAHEIYHVFYQEREFISKIEFANHHYYEHEEEYAANLFAGMLLMPETGFRRMYTKFRDESGGNELDTILRLMAYYQVPYMAVLIRCYELKLPENLVISEELLNADRELVCSRFEELWLDDRILNASNKDDYPHIEALVERQGKDFLKEEYLNERTLEKVLQNMKKLYGKIRGA